MKIDFDAPTEIAKIRSFSLVDDELAE